VEDAPTRELLARPPLERLDPAQRTALASIAEANSGLILLFAGKVAARMHAADVRVHEIDIWVDLWWHDRDLDHLALQRAVRLAAQKP
jgi:hypothetical protein